MSTITTVLSGGQSGADRGAMDAAAHCGIGVGGWCPAGGWAEDMPEPPGVRALYPQMTETPSGNVAQRTEWNIRDSTCCLVFNTKTAGTSPGTDIGFSFYEKYSTPYFEFSLDDPTTYDEQIEQARAWLDSLDDDNMAISIGGPRASEYPGIYDIAYRVTEALLSSLGIASH